MAEIDPTLYKNFVEARDHAKQAKQLFDGLAAEIKAAAGEDQELTVNGQKVGTYERIAKFPVQKFIKENPDLAQQFMVIKADEVFDEALFRRSLPSIYAKYQTRQLVIEG